MDVITRRGNHGLRQRSEEATHGWNNKNNLKLYGRVVQPCCKLTKAATTRRWERGWKVRRGLWPGNRPAKPCKDDVSIESVGSRHINRRNSHEWIGHKIHWFGFLQLIVIIRQNTFDIWHAYALTWLGHLTGQYGATWLSIVVHCCQLMSYNNSHMTPHLSGPSGPTNWCKVDEPSKQLLPSKQSL